MADAPTKRPAFQFYPSDWRTDPGLRLCSIPARGLWIEMLCIMHSGTPYGTLTISGRPVSTSMLAKLVGECVTDVQTWQDELQANDVYSVDGQVIFSRRMVRDERLREARAAGGHLGAEHGHKGGAHGAKGAAHGKKGGRPKTKTPPLADENDTLIGGSQGAEDTPPLRRRETPAPSSSSPSPSSTPSEEDSLSGRNLSEGTYARGVRA